ncbi:MAG: hypothetical protein J6S67_07545 [Methanobrevibacter sp.]|nr:hypothetical protein [Methanobrevibacter sp.]
MANNTGNTTKKAPTKADLEAQIAELQAQLLAAQQQIAQQIPVATAPTVTVSAPNTDVSVVYCSDSLGFAKISNMELHFNRYGEEFVMSRTQFDELVGKYRKWFDRGVLAVSYRNVDVAAAKGLKTDKEMFLDAKKLESIGVMSAGQLEMLWNSLENHTQKESVVSYYKRKFIEGANGFVNREKVDLLNRLTDGGFRREQDEISGRYKIDKTVM